MKRYKRVFILLGVLIVVVVAAFAASRIQERQEDIRTSGETFLSIAPDTVTALSWENGDASFAFHSDGKWLWDEDADFPVDQDAIADLLAPFEDLSAAFVIDSVTDYGQYGLTDPECTVDIKAGDTEYTVKLGAFSTLDQQRYVDIGDGNVYLAAEDPKTAFDVELSDLLARDTIPELDPASFSVSGAVTLKAEYDEEGDSYCDEDVYFTDSGLPLDTSRVSDWLDRFETLSLTDYADYNATGDELAAYGLDSPDLTVSIERKEGAPITFQLSNVIPEGAESEEETKAYLRINEGQIVYAIAPGDYTVIAQASYDDLRHRELFTGSFDSVTSVDVTLEGADYTLARGENDEGETVWLYGDSEVDISDLSAALTALSASSFTDDTADGREEISLTLHLSDDAHPEYSLTLTRVDGSVCSAAVNGKTVCTVSRSQAVDLIEAVNAIVL